MKLHYKQYILFCTLIVSALSDIPVFDPVLYPSNEDHTPEYYGVPNYADEVPITVDSTKTDATFESKYKMDAHAEAFAEAGVGSEALAHAKVSSSEGYETSQEVHVKQSGDKTVVLVESLAKIEDEESYNLAKAKAYAITDGYKTITDAYAYTGNCNKADNFVYAGECVPKSCYKDKLSRVVLSPRDPRDGNVGELSTFIEYAVKYGPNQDDKMVYTVSIRFSDIEENQLLSQPRDCVNFRVYQTKNSYEIDSTRLFQYVEGQIPQEPNSVYGWNKEKNCGEITFSFTQAQLDEYQCLKMDGFETVQYECFYEMAFVVKEITQVSYYFNILIHLDTHLNSKVPQSVNFFKIVQVEQCPLGAQHCNQEVTVETNLQFCRDETCNDVQSNPFYQLILNSPFWLKHSIVNNDFKDVWFIKEIQIYFQSMDFKMVLGENEFKLLKSVPGYNIYQLSAPIVAKDVLVSAKGILQKARRFLSEDQQNQNYQDPKNFIAKASGRTGEIQRISNYTSFDPQTINEVQDYRNMSWGSWLDIPVVAILAYLVW